MTVNLVKLHYAVFLNFIWTNVTVFTEILSSTTVLNIDNKMKCLIIINNNLLHLYSALHSKGGISPHPPPVCSIHLDDVTAAIVRQNAHHTPAYWWRGDNQCMGIVRRPWWSEANGLVWPGLHPYSFSKDMLGFLMTTESQDLGLTPHPKDGSLFL